MTISIRVTNRTPARFPQSSREKIWLRASYMNDKKAEKKVNRAPNNLSQIVRQQDTRSLIVGFNQHRVEVANKIKISTTATMKMEAATSTPKTSTMCQVNIVRPSNLPNSKFNKKCKIMVPTKGYMMMRLCQINWLLSRLSTMHGDLHPDLAQQVKNEMPSKSPTNLNPPIPALATEQPTAQHPLAKRAIDQEVPNSLSMYKVSSTHLQFHTTLNKMLPRGNLPHRVRLRKFYRWKKTNLNRNILLNLKLIRKRVQ